MAIEPSYRTAAAAGLWSAVGLVPFDLWRARAGSASPVADNLAWFVVLALFLYLPGYFLVVGTSATRFSRAWLSDPVERQRYLAVVRRVLVWLVVAGGAGLALSHLMASLRT